MINVAVAICTVKKHAVSVGKLIEAFANPDLAHKVLFKFYDFHLQSVRHRGDFFFVNPYITGGSGAAVAASRTFEFEPIFVPGFFVRFVGHGILKGIVLQNSDST